jgi:hypothetical protein
MDHRYNGTVLWDGYRDKRATSKQVELFTVLGNPSAWPWRKFDIFGSMFFCFTLITTIGYGTFAPTTIGGKLFACAYCCFGIPLMAALFGDTAECARTHTRTHARTSSHWA